MTEMDWRKAGVCINVSRLRDTILPNDVKQLGLPTGIRASLSDLDRCNSAPQ